MRKDHFHFRYVNELTGLFILTVAALVLAGVVFSGHSQRWFARKYTFEVLLPEAGTAGLRNGDEVLILGISAGLIDSILVGDDGRMKARVKIRRDFERFVRRDSTAAIKKAFAVAGDSYMEVSRGTGMVLSAQAPLITCLPSEDSLDRMEKILGEIQLSLLPVVKNAGVGLERWAQLGADLQGSRAQVEMLVARLDRLATGVEEGRGTAGKLFTDPALADETREILGRANETMKQMHGMVTGLVSAASSVQAGTARLPEIADTVADETKDLSILIGQTRTSMIEFERLIEALQRHWLVRRYINPTNPPSTRVSGPEPRPAKPLRSTK